VPASSVPVNGVNPRLDCAGWAVEVDPSLWEVAGPRCHLEAFKVQGPPRLRLHRSSQPLTGTAFSLAGSPAEWGSYQVEGNRVLAHVPDDPFAGEAIIRVAYYLSVIAQGGVLLHASAVAFADRALAAVGPSGAGKSTFAALAAAHGGRVLSDEIIACLPDGECRGSPFRSEPALQGSPSPARLSGMFVLRHGAEERVDSVSPADAAAALLAQRYRASHEPVQRADLAPIDRLLSHPGVRRLTFRNHPDAGRFLREWAAQ
jgi:hypothetical protein